MNITVVERKPLEFKEVYVSPAQAGELAAAERITGKTDGIEYTIAVISQCCTFDEKKLPPEDLSGLSIDDLTALGNAVAPSKQTGLLKP